MRIALYGKGGIGKSTMAANLSAALAGHGKRVLQIGCDPKHDSTRLLLAGQRATTVLDYLRETPPDQQRLADVLHVGSGGVVCVEAGGPEPGVGCAGRGILSTFALLDSLGLDTAAFDVVLYDVLGDVVCGGFAVPLRAGYADVVCIVTSEEFMALYAANNILRGVQNFEGAGTRMAGLILNSRGAEESPAGVQRFADAVQLPLLASFPRSDLFRQAEQQGRTVVEAFADSTAAASFHALAHDLLHQPALWPALPLDDADLERVVLGKATQQMGADAPARSTEVEPHAETDASTVTMPASGASYTAKFARGGGDAAAQPAPTPAAARFLSKNMLFREPLHGCAFAGVVSTTTQIQGASTIAHGPQSCTHIAGQIMRSSGMHALQRAGIAIPEQLLPNLHSTDMSEAASIYGGAEPLRATLQGVLHQHPAAVFVATTCPAGIIGDDVPQIIRNTAGDTAVPIIPITSDGNMAGDYMQGVINACIDGAAALIDPHCPAEENLVNIVAEKNIATNTEPNLHEMARLLEHLGVQINCRFVRRTSVEALRGFLKAPLNLLAYNDHLGRVLHAFLVERFRVRFAQYPFPVGFTETARWLRDIAHTFGRTERAEAVIAQAQADYANEMQRLRPALAGRRLMIVTYSHDIDWVVEAALDAGMELVKVGILNYVEDYGFRTRYAGQFPVETGYAPDQRAADIERYTPHLLLSAYAPAHPALPVHIDTIPLCPDTGFFSGLHLARRWSTLLHAPIHEGWRNDRDLAAPRHP